MREEEIINYTELADAHIIEIFKSATIELPDAVRLFSHVLNAQHIWAQRISGKTPFYGVWDIHLTKDFESLSLENFRLIREALNNHPLDKRVLYTNTRGDQYENCIDEILFHLFNHSTYHRGQVVTLLKKAGFTPPVTDYIMLKRDHLL
ncbi:DinB family protein [Pedobacter alluvionis]|uniref:Damage-inducible protein DinB n=1 Tax=Pedobacter alluvionis TaxID=475253 RepID=A0A497XXV0_9SPHI|nr:DinB family protein [Pedobacter alluvionis]RLJ72142.1 DinB family protein [Pedobacter alluvionis]TFB28909.1 damage-inducible protein DinB [Pedobacter alluvionis]